MHDYLKAKVKTLSELMWAKDLLWSDVERWLSQFASPPDTGFSEQLHALFLLSHFSYFNSDLMRVLLRTLYRDLVQYPIVARLRRQHDHTLDWAILQPHFERELMRLRFIGIGNPSESGTHLLYYFRQENRLPTDLFVHPHELFESNAAKPQLISGVNQLIFLDDFCGSGTQAGRYSKRLLRRIRELDKQIQLSYFPVCATTYGISKVRNETLFTIVETLCELDNSFRALDNESRYFRESHDSLSREFALDMCRRHGALLEPCAPLGFGNCQLLLGFAHNIPNNTLPIFWSEGQPNRLWDPIFRRYTKTAGW